MIDNNRNDILYESMLKRIFAEYCDLVVLYIPEDKTKLVQELGRTKAHTQKKLAKAAMHEVEEPKRLTYILARYNDLTIQLLSQLYRFLKDKPEDYRSCKDSLDAIVEAEKAIIRDWYASLTTEEGGK